MTRTEGKGTENEDTSKGNATESATIRVIMATL